MSALTIVLYEPGSSYDHYVYATVTAGRDVRADRNGIPQGDPRAINYLPANSNSPGGETGSSASGTVAGRQAGGPTCGSYCSSISFCTGNDGCTCIADPWQGVGSRYFTGTCKMSFRGRHLDEVASNHTSSDKVNGTPSTSTPGPLQTASLSGSVCPCNCTYVSKACCNSEGIVYEAPSLRLGALQPPDSNVTCNVTTGEFEQVR